MRSSAVCLHTVLLPRMCYQAAHHHQVSNLRALLALTLPMDPEASYMAYDGLPCARLCDPPNIFLDMRVKVPCSWTETQSTQFVSRSTVLPNSLPKAHEVASRRTDLFPGQVERLHAEIKLRLHILSFEPRTSSFNSLSMNSSSIHYVHVCPKEMQMLYLRLTWIN